MKLDAESVKRQVRIEDVVRSFGIDLRAAGPGELVAKCPLHKDDTPSFTVTPSKGVFYCFGCNKGGDAFQFLMEISPGMAFAEAVQQVAEIGGIDAKPLPPPPPSGPPKITAVYPYIAADGELLYEVCRKEPGRNGKAKDFEQRRHHPVDGSTVWGIKGGVYRRRDNGEWYRVKDDEPRQEFDDDLPEVERVLYRLPEVLAASEVWVVEGEKDANTLAERGICGTTNSGGASQPWLPSYTEALKGKSVLILPDNDKPGQERGERILKELRAARVDAVIVQVPFGKDVTEYIQQGGSIDELAETARTERRDRIAAALEARGLYSPEEIILSIEGGLSAFLDPSKRAPGILTGFRRLDEMTLGLHSGDLFILAARPSMGKTALALNIGANVAAQNNTPVAVFSLEMSKEQLLFRVLCAHARVDAQRARAGFLGAEERRRLQQAFLESQQWPLFIDDGLPGKLDAFERKLKTLCDRTGKAGLVVVDYLQLMEGARKENRQTEVTAISRGLKLLAKKLKAPALVLSQLSRAPDARPGDHRPQLSDLRESGAIEQDADVVAFIFREEYYKRDDPSLKGKADLIVAKQRNGPVGSVPLAFNRHIVRFDNPVMDNNDATEHDAAA